LQMTFPAVEGRERKRRRTLVKKGGEKLLRKVKVKQWGLRSGRAWWTLWGGLMHDADK